MSLEIAWKQNILVTDFHLLKSLLVVFGFGLQAFLISADKTFAVHVYLRIGVSRNGLSLGYSE